MSSREAYARRLRLSALYTPQLVVAELTPASSRASSATLLDRTTFETHACSRPALRAGAGVHSVGHTEWRAGLTDPQW
jgi:hypothetical protein